MDEGSEVKGEEDFLKKIVYHFLPLFLVCERYLYLYDMLCCYILK